MKKVLSIVALMVLGVIPLLGGLLTTTYDDYSIKSTGASSIDLEDIMSHSEVRPPLLSDEETNTDDVKDSVPAPAPLPKSAPMPLPRMAPSPNEVPGRLNGLTVQEWLMLIGGINTLLLGWVPVYLQLRDKRKYKEEEPEGEPNA